MTEMLDPAQRIQEAVGRISELVGPLVGAHLQQGSLEKYSAIKELGETIFRIAQQNEALATIAALGPKVRRASDVPASILERVIVPQEWYRPMRRHKGFIPLIITGHREITIHAGESKQSFVHQFGENPKGDEELMLFNTMLLSDRATAKRTQDIERYRHAKNLASTLRYGTGHDIIHERSTSRDGYYILFGCIYVEDLRPEPLQFSSSAPAPTERLERSEPPEPRPIPTTQAEPLSPPAVRVPAKNNDTTTVTPPWAAPPPRRTPTTAATGGAPKAPRPNPREVFAQRLQARFPTLGIEVNGIRRYCLPEVVYVLQTRVPQINPADVEEMLLTTNLSNMGLLPMVKAARQGKNRSAVLNHYTGQTIAWLVEIYTA